jgi:membrane glycosyltransferase
MSHDFVEAALLRRGGWRVVMAWSLRGSYEESPPTLAAAFARDRRWCQGNLQHLLVLNARGLHWFSRFHLLGGVLYYFISVFWLSLLLSTAALPLWQSFSHRSGSGHTVARAQSFDLATGFVLFGPALAFLLAPKVLAYVEMLLKGRESDDFGGLGLSAANVVFETILSTLISPLIMLNHVRSLVEVVTGSDSGWVVQVRDQAGPGLIQAARRHAADTLLGFALAAAVLEASPCGLPWTAPVFAGLVLAIPLATATSSNKLGRAARRVGLLLVPEERQPPRVLARANFLTKS